MDKRPLRILIVNGKMICGGIESFIMNIYRNIDRSKIQFDFLVHYKERFFYDDEIERLGGNIYRLSFRNDNNLLKYKKDLRNFFETHTYNIVWGQMDGLASIYLKAAKKAGVATTICHSHITNSEAGIKGILKALLRINLNKWVDIRFACSSEAGKHLYGKHKFLIFNNAIDTENFRYSDNKNDFIRLKLNIPNDAFIIGHIGRFSPQKNHKFLIDMFAKLVSANKSFYLILAGDGELFKEIKEYVDLMNISKNVIFLGNVTNISDYYSCFDLFVMPSLYEGLPVSGVEAQTNGLTCLFADTITREISLTNRVKFLPINKGPECWIKEIMKLYDDKELVRHDTRSIEEIRLKGYDIKNQVKKIENFFRDLNNEQNKNN